MVTKRLSVVPLRLVLNPYPAILAQYLGIAQRAITEQACQGKHYDGHEHVPPHALEAPDALLHRYIFLNRVTPGYKFIF